MKYTLTSLRHLTAPTFALAVAAGIFLGAVSARAQSTTTRTISGVFKSSEGNKGTYKRTIVTNGATVTDTIVYTRTSDQATSTDVNIRTTNADGSRTDSITDTDFGATTSYTAQKTVTKEGHGQYVGRGTYTTASGDSGILTSLESAGGVVNVVTTVRNSPTTGQTEVLDLENDEDGLTEIKRIDLPPTGAPTTVVLKRFILNVEG